MLFLTLETLEFVHTMDKDTPVSTWQHQPSTHWSCAMCNEL